MQLYLIEMLVCPRCHGELAWEITEQDAASVNSAGANCLTCEAKYQVRDGVGMFLTPDLIRNDLWEAVDSRISQYARENPDFERSLLEVPLDDLAPADQFLRSQVLMDRGMYREAEHAAAKAQLGLYTPEYLSRSSEQIEVAIDRLKKKPGPIVDLASGQGTLVEALAQELNCPIVATDFSPSVLMRDRERLTHLNLANQVDLLAFDARRTPFRDSAIETLTTYQGLQNISDPAGLLTELRRIVSGEFLALCIFVPEEDEKNRAVVDEFGLSEFFVRAATVRQFKTTGWQVEILHSCIGWAEPTPPSRLIEDLSIDAIPAFGTSMEWCLLRAT